MFKRLRNLMLLALVPIAVAAFIRLRPEVGPASPRGGTVQDIGQVDRGDIALTISATGPIQANQNVSLSFSATGKVMVINVKEGDHVVKGQLIASLDNQAAMDAVLLAQAKVASQQVALDRLTNKPRQVDLNVAEAALNLAKAQLADANTTGPNSIQVQIDKLNVEIAKNLLWQAELARDINNQQKAALLGNPRTSSQASTLPTDNQNSAQLNASGYDVNIAQAQLAADQSRGGDVAGINSAQAQIVAAQVALDNLLKGGDANDVAMIQAQLSAANAALDYAKDILAKTTLIAPFDGVVAKVNLHIGENPPPSGAVVMIDTSSFYVDVAVSEQDINRVSVGQPVDLTFDALAGVTVKGQVARIAQTATRTGDVVSFVVRIQIDPAGEPLLSSMSATATIVTSHLANVLRVPNRFVRVDSATGKTSVSVRQPDGSFKEIEVVLGLRNDTYSEVKSGLAAGDVVTLPAAPPLTSSGSSSGGPGQ